GAGVIDAAIERDEARRETDGGIIDPQLTRGRISRNISGKGQVGGGRAGRAGGNNEIVIERDVGAYNASARRRAPLECKLVTGATPSHNQRPEKIGRTV